MTRRRERNRDARRALAAQYTARYACPDCGADKRLSDASVGVYLLDIEHDETCPHLAAMNSDALAPDGAP